MSSRDGHPHASPPMIWSGDPSLPVPIPVHPGAYPAQQTLPPALARGFDFWGLLKALKRHWVLALTLSLICPALVGAAAWKLMPAPRYTAVAQILIKSTTPRVLGGSEFGNINEIKQFQKTQQAIIKSYSILDTGFKEAMRNAKVANSRFIASLQKNSDPLTWLDKELRVESIGDVMAITLSGEDPFAVQHIVNAVTNAYIAKQVDEELFKRRGTFENLRTYYENYQKDLKEKRDGLRKVADAAGSNNSETLEFKHQMALELEGMVNKEYVEAKIEREQAEIELQMFRDRQRPAPDPAAIAATAEALLARDPIINDLQASIQDLEGRKNNVRGVARNTANEPMTRNTNRQIDELKRQLNERIALVRPDAEKQALQAVMGDDGQDEATLVQKLDFCKRREAMMKMQVDDLAKGAEKIHHETADIQQLQDEIENLEATTRKFAQQVDLARVEVEAPSRIEVLEEAQRPKIPDLKRRIIVSSGAALATLAFVLLGIAWLEYRVRRIGSTDEVSHGLGLRLVGALPATPTRQRFALPGQSGLQEANWRSRLNESVNAIRTLMLRQSQLERLQVVMVTSATVGEGKTSLACHLATSLARAGRKSLLLDCDLRNPTAHRVFDLPLEPGLSEILRGTVALEDASHPIALGELRMITAGRCDLQALHALGLDQMREIFNRLRQQYDFIIVDTPPVLPVADAILVGQHVDASLFSILRDVSRIHRVHAACERLSSLGIRILGAVVAGTPLDTHGSEYHYTAYTGDPVGSKENS